MRGSAATCMFGRLLLGQSIMVVHRRERDDEGLGGKASASGYGREACARRSGFRTLEQMHQVTRRSALALIFAGGAAALASACASPAPAAQPTQAPAAPANAAPRSGGTLR